MLSVVTVVAPAASGRNVTVVTLVEASTMSGVRRKRRVGDSGTSGQPDASSTAALSPVFQPSAPGRRRDRAAERLLHRHVRLRRDLLHRRVPNLDGEAAVDRARAVGRLPQVQQRQRVVVDELVCRRLEPERRSSPTAFRWGWRRLAAQPGSARGGRSTPDGVARRQGQRHPTGSLPSSPVWRELLENAPTGAVFGIQASVRH